MATVGAAADIGGARRKPMTVVLGPIIKKVAGISGLAKFAAFSYRHSGRRRETNGDVAAITAWTLRRGSAATLGGGRLTA